MKNFKLMLVLAVIFILASTCVSFANQALDVIHSRKSVRNYTQEPAGVEKPKDKFDESNIHWGKW